MSPRVSVITPFLDAAATLEDAVGSVRWQTLNEWELILVDDGSTDGSAGIARAACEVDRRVRLLSSPKSAPLGPAAARNAGMRQARGEFLAFLDADDVLEPDALAEQVAALDRHPGAAMVYGAARWWYPRDERHDWVESMRGLSGRLHAPPTLLAKVLLLQRGEVPCTCAVLVRREAALRVGGFEEGFRLYEDQTLWAKLFLSEHVLVLDRCLASYRQHAGSASARAQSSGTYDRWAPHAARAAFLDWLAGRVERSGVRDRALNRALRMARVPYRGGATLSWPDRAYVLFDWVSRRFERRVRRRLERGMLGLLPKSGGRREAGADQSRPGIGEMSLGPYGPTGLRRPTAGPAGGAAGFPDRGARPRGPGNPPEIPI